MLPATRSTVRAPQLARAFVRQLNQEDRTLVEELLAQDAETLLADQFRIRFSRTRSAIFAALDIPSQQQQTVRVREPRGKSLFQQISEWREYDPESGQRPLLEMTGQQLRRAIGRRTQALMTHVWRTEVLVRLEPEVADEQLVGDVFSAEDLAEMVINVRKEMYRGNLRLRVKPVPPLPSATPIPRQAHGRRAKRSKADRGLAAE